MSTPARGLTGRPAIVYLARMNRAEELKAYAVERIDVLAGRLGSRQTAYHVLAEASRGRLTARGVQGFAIHERTPTVTYLDRILDALDIVERDLPAD